MGIRAGGYARESGDRTVGKRERYIARNPVAILSRAREVRRLRLEIRSDCEQQMANGGDKRMRRG